MAIYVELLDGSYAEFADGTSDDQINAAVQEFSSRPPAQPEIPQEDREGFGAAAAASMARMEGERALAKGKAGLISEEEAMRVYNAQKAEADRLFTPTDDTFSFRNLKELAGGSLPYMAAPVAAGVAGSVAGSVIPGVGTALGGIGASFAASAAQFSGSNLARQIDEGKSFQEASGAKALAGALPMAALDTFALGKIPGVRQILGRAGIEVSEGAAAAIARKGVANAAIDYTTATGKALTYEGATEAGQQFIERLQAGLNIGDEAARGEYFDSFIGGAILGGAIAPAGRFLERRGAQKDVENKAAKEESETLQDQVLAGQAEEEAVIAAQDIDPDASVDDLLREQATLRNSGETDPVTRARLAALNAVIRPQLAGDVEALRAQTTAEQDVALQEQTAQDDNDARARASAFSTAEEDIFGNLVSPAAALSTEPEVEAASTPAAMRRSRQEAKDAGQIELPLRRTPAGRPTTTPIPETPSTTPLPEGALSLQDIKDTNVPMKTSKGWFEANVVGKTPEEVQALVTADPTLIVGPGQRAKVLREILAPIPPAFKEAPRDIILAEPGLTDGPAATEPTVSERATDESSLGLPDVAAPIADPTGEPAASEQSGVVSTGLPAGDGDAKPKRSRVRTLKPVRAEDIVAGNELNKWRTTRARVTTPGAMVGNTEVEAFLHAIDTQDGAGAQIALDDIARVLRSLPKSGDQAARAFVTYMNKQTDGGFDGPLNNAFNRIRETPSASAPIAETESQERTRRKAPVDKKYLEPVRITKDNRVVRSSQRLLVPMGDDVAKKYLMERGLNAAERKLDEIDAAPKRDTPQVGQQELDFTAPVQEAKKPKPVEAKKAEVKVEPKAKPAKVETKTKYRVTYDGKPATVTIVRTTEDPTKIDYVTVKVDGEKYAWVNLGKQGVVSDEKMLNNLIDTDIIDAIGALDSPIQKNSTGVEAAKPTVQPWMDDIASQFNGGARVVPVSDTLAVAVVQSAGTDNIIIGAKHKPTANDPNNFTYTTQDLSAGIPKSFTAEETALITDAHAKLVKERADLDAKYPDGKFSATDSNVKATPAMEPYAKFVEGLLKQLGLSDQRIILIASGETRSNPLAYGLTPSMEWFDSKLGAETQGTHRARLSKPGVSGITLNPSVLATGDRQLIIETIAHELGHMIEHRALASASPEVRAGLQKAHEAWLRQQKGKTAKELVEALRNRKMAESGINAMSFAQQADSVDTPASREMEIHVDYLKSFSEWFADNVSRWTTTNEKPVGLVEKFFADLAKQLRKLASIVTGKRFMPDRAVAKFLDEMGAMDFTSVNSALSGRVENFARSTPIDAIVASSEMAQVPPGPMTRAVKMMIEAFSATAGIDFVDKFRTLTVDAAASAERRLNVLFDGAVRSSKGILNPMGLYRQAQDTSKLLLDWFIDGALAKDKLTGTYRTVKGAHSMNEVLTMVKAWGTANGYKFEEAYNTLSKVFEAKRLDSLRKENVILKSNGETQYGINALSKKREQQGVSKDKQIDEMLAFAEKHKKAVDAIQTAMDSVRFGLIDGMVSTGRLSAADGVNWKKNSNYIPFERMSEYDDMFRTQKSTGKGISQLKKLPEFLGSETREVGNTFDNFVKTSGWMIEQTIKQDANLSTLKMLERLGQATRHRAKGRISDSKLVPAFDKGEKIYYELPSRWDVMAFKDLAPPKGALVNFLSSFSNVLRTTITSMPPFAVRQVVNDIQRAFATSGVEQPLKLVYPALRNFLVISGAELMGRRHPSVREFGRLGVIGDFDFNTRDPMSSILYDLGYQSRGKSKKKRYTDWKVLPVRLTWRFVKAIYDQTIAEKGDTLLATTRSREFINFRRRGASSVMPALASTIPFFNAYLQGMDVLLRAATGKSAAAGLDKAAAKKMFYAKVTQMAAFSTLYAIMSSGEDYYDEAGLQIRHNNWMLPGGIKFPVPEELGAIFKVPAEMMVEYFMRNGTKEEMQASDATFTALKYAFAQYSPIGGRMTPIPAAIKPVIEAVTNYSFFTGRELEGVYQRSQLLPSQRTRGNTSELAQAISKFTETLLGENNAISPIMIDNTLQGYFGSVAGIITMGTDQLINSDRMDRPLQKYWMLSNFLYDPIGSRRLDEFYELRSKTFGVKGTLDKLAKEDLDAAVKFANEHINELSLAQGIGSALGQLSDTRRYKNYLNSNMAAQSMSQDERATSMEETRRLEQGLVGWLREVQADVNKAK